MSLTNSQIYSYEDINYTLDVIWKTYGVRASVKAKGKSLLKFGRNHGVGTSPTTVMTLLGTELHETYVSSNIIDTVSSSAVADTQEVTIEGNTVDGSGNFTFVEQTATLNGRNKVVLGTPLARATRLYNSDSTEMVGNIYVYQEQAITLGVPQTNNKVHIVVLAGEQQTHKASTTISNTDYWLVTIYSADVYEKSAAFADVELQVRKKGGVFLPVDSISASSSSGSVAHIFKPLHIIPPNADIRLVAVADGVSTDVGGSIHGYLAKIV